MKIINKYLIRTWIIPLLGSLFFYGALIVTNEAMVLSKEVFVQGASISWLALLLLSALPELLSIILPIAALLSGLLGTQSLSINSEVVAAQGAGVGYRTWIKSWSIFAFLILLGGLVNSHFFTPWSNSRQQAFRDSMSETLRSRVIKPGGQPWSPPTNPNMTIWSDFGGNTHIVEVRPNEVQHMIGKDISYTFFNNFDGSSRVSIDLQNLNGALYVQASDSVILVDQKEQALVFPIPPPKRIWKSTPLRSIDTISIYKQMVSFNDLARDPKINHIEISRRWSLPFASVAFLLLGISIGFRHPRFKKSSAAIISLFTVLAYYFLYRYIENLYLLNEHAPSYVLYTTTIFTFMITAYAFYRSLKPIPSQSNRVPLSIKKKINNLIGQSYLFLDSSFLTQSRSGKKAGRTLARYLSSSLLKNWVIVILSTLLIHLVINFSNLAGDIIKNNLPFMLFFKYWIVSLPEFLNIIGPIVFLASAALTLTQKSITREWVAMKSSGINLFRWMRFSYPALAILLMFSLTLSLLLGPATIKNGDLLYRQIIGRNSNKIQTTSENWITLKTEVSKPTILWYASNQDSLRWGFPLADYLESDPIIKFEEKSGLGTAFDWTGQRREYPNAWNTFFPSKALRSISSPATTSTLDLFSWLIWSNDPQRNYELMSRLFGWLLGPLLLFACLSYALPDSKQGRSRALGIILFSSLLFLGINSIIVGATQSGEIPVWWGTLAPLLFLFAIGLIRHERVHT
jgi:lipopolysaccharide export LptBFGC system permease protein LptF